MSGKLVFVSRRMPHPPTNGARVRTSRLLKGLSSAFETTFVVFEHPPGTADAGCTGDELRDLFPGVEVVIVPARSTNKRVAQARTLLSTRSWTFGRYRKASFQRALMSAVARRRPPIVHLDDQGVGQYGPIPGTLSVLATHNVEYRIVQGTARADRGTRRAFAAVDWRKLKREEERLWRRMPLCLAVSEPDAAIMRAAGAARVAICPNGTDRVAPLPVPRRTAREPLRLLFLGSASYDPYERGIAWLVLNVLPRVRERIPVTFDVVGVPPVRPVNAPGVTYVGPVPSVTPFYQRAHALVVPVFEGSGTRLKVIEAMAHARPVVSTGLGVEGLPVEDGREYLRADDPRGFADSLVRLGAMLEREDHELDQMLASARAAIAPLFWDQIVADLVRLYRSESTRRED
jgi:glycosyltransferase involved in cell wall biosynthesis